MGKKYLVFSGETCHESYDKLILSPGAYPYVPSILGIEMVWKNTQ